MQGSRNLSSRSGSLPVFIFPPQLSFFVDDVTSHKQIVTVCNPYNFTLRYKLYSNIQSDDKYKVTEPEGVISPECVVDVVIRHLQAYPQNVRRADKFRVKIYRHSDRNFIAQKDVPSTLYRSRADKPADFPVDDRFQQVPGRDVTLSLNPGIRESSQSDQDGQDTGREAIDRPRGPEPLIIFIALLCITILAVPCPGEPNEYLPDHIRVSMNYKLIAAFFLGIATISIFKS